MTAVVVDVIVDAPPAAVWNELEQLERHSEWMADAAAIRFEGHQRRGLGVRLIVETRVGPLRLDDHLRVTEWVEGRAIGMAHEGLVTGTGRFSLEPAGSGTRFTWTETLRFPWWMGGALGSWIAGRLVLAPLWRRNLRRLKHLVESAP